MNKSPVRQSWFEKLIDALEEMCISTHATKESIRRRRRGIMSLNSMIGAENGAGAGGPNEEWQSMACDFGN